MPYIRESRRDDIDPYIASLSERISTDGELNYAFTKLLLGREPTNYAEYNALIGILECCKLEMYRRAVASYEDKKREEMGDVY